jgi:surface protein
MQRLLAFALLGSAAAFKPIARTLNGHELSAVFYLRETLNSVCNYDNNCAVVDNGTADNVYLPSKDNANGIPIADWDVSEVTSMQEMFYGEHLFDADLSAWDVGQVTNMQSMFYGASKFNQDLSAWDVAQVTDMQEMFRSAYAFNQDLSAWNVGRVITMYRMFSSAYAFSQTLCGQAWVDKRSLRTNWDASAQIPATPCTLCPAGEFNNAGTCAPCQVATAQTEGTYSARAGQTICLACPALTISDTTGCSSCNPGMFVNGDSCSDCPAGTYRSATDSAQECVGCPAGKYGTEEGKESEGDGCSECPNGWSTFDDAATVCNPSYQTHTDLLVDASQNCQTECPDSCAGATADVLVNAILNNPTAYQQAGLCT